MFRSCSAPQKQQAALPILSLVGQNSNHSVSSQKQKRKSNSIVGHSSQDEENRLQVSTNIIVDSNNVAHKNKSPRLDKPTCDTMNFIVPTIDTNRESPSVQGDFSPNASECGTEVSTVSARRQWLKTFEKKQSDNIFRSMVTKENTPENAQARDNGAKEEPREVPVNKNVRESPPSSPKSSVSFGGRLSTSHFSVGVTNSATKPKQLKPVINRRASSAAMMHSYRGRIHDGVQATDEGYASVKSLSKWLEADPTSAKKKKHVRRGRNIISKSRQFEKDMEDVIILETKISRGAVGDKKKWLQNAFQSVEEEPDEDTCSTYSGYVQSDVGRSATTYPRYNRPGAQTEIITDDAASSMSVSDKKDWLKNAFTKNSEERKKLGYTTTQTDVLHNRDQAVSRAKLRFKERSARKLSVAVTGRASLKPVPSIESKDSIESSQGTDREVPEEPAVAVDAQPKKAVEVAEPVEEDTTSVDFRAAREALVERSKKNGHNAQVVNKVFLRKKKFEKLEQESRRKSMGIGLVMKTSWDIAEPSKGRPSTVYEKRVVPMQNIAPKKSFEELP